MALALKMPRAMLRVMVPSSDFEIRPLDGCTFVRPPGPRLDATSAPALKDAVAGLTRSGSLRVVLSLSRLEQIDSSGLGALIALHRSLGPPRGRLVICEVPARIQPILKTTRLDHVLVQANDPDGAATLARGK
jgi:anti-sigma B factor antagonist